MQTRWYFLLFCVAVLCAPNRARAQTAADAAADSAWVNGDYDRADRLYVDLLAANATHVMALRRLALLRAWGGRYEQSVQYYDRLLRLEPDNTVISMERARTLGWARRYADAIQALDAVLQANPLNKDALEERARITSWAGRFDESLRNYGRLIEITPGDPALLVARARVLSWAKEYDDAIKAYRELLQTKPNDRDLMLGLAQSLSWSGRGAEASQVFQQLLARDPKDLDALRGLASSATYTGDLINGEKYWHDVLTVAPKDMEALIGLGANLRWQGRDADARAILRQARLLDRNNPEVNMQLRYVNSAFAPNAAPTYTYESDSDNNTMRTTSASLAWRFVPATQLRVQGYRRVLEGPDLHGGVVNSVVTGGTAGIAFYLNPGWILSGGAGASRTDQSGARTLTSTRFSLASPIAPPVAAALSFSHGALDATAVLAAREITTEQVLLDMRGRATALWLITATAGTALYKGTQSNRQYTGTFNTTYHWLQPLTVGVTARAFVFDKGREDLSEGYFNPDFYGALEGTATVYHEFPKVVVSGGVALGAQQIGRTNGDHGGEYRVNGRLAYVFGLGRQLGVSAAFANSGVGSFSPTASSSYNYQAFSIFSSWSF